jgi:hypothetical protein
MKSIMYHYVRAYDDRFPHFKFLDISNFCRQLDYLQDTFGFLSQVQFLDCVKSGKRDSGVVLTFDDAFKDHYSFVYPELKKRGLWGIFYVPTGPYVNLSILDVHRVHLILGKIGGDRALEILSSLVKDYMLKDDCREAFHKATYSTQTHETNQSLVQVKRILNYFLDYSYREQVIDALMAVCFDKNELDELLTGFYMSLDEINEMSENGMVIGSHTVSHPVLSKLTENQQSIEIEESFAFLRKHVKSSTHNTFCYPHGGFHTFTDFTEKLLTDTNVMYSFNVEPRDIEDTDLQTRPQALPRYDCNLFPHGQAR